MRSRHMTLPRAVRITIDHGGYFEADVSRDNLFRDALGSR